MLFKRWCFSFPYSTHSSCCKVSMVQVYLFDNFNYCTYFRFSQKVGRTILTTYQFSVPWCPTVISNSTNLTERYSCPLLTWFIPLSACIAFTSLLALHTIIKAVCAAGSTWPGPGSCHSNPSPPLHFTSLPPSWKSEIPRKNSKHHREKKIPSQATLDSRLTSGLMSLSQGWGL